MDHLPRRDFLRLGAAATLAALAGTARAADAPARPRALRKAIMYATIGLKGTILEKFQAVQAAGFAGVEAMSHLPQDEVVAAYEKTGLEPASVCCDTHWAKPLSHPDPKVRQDGLDGVTQALKDAKRYGATSVLLVPGRVKEGTTYDQCFERSVAEIRKLTPLAGELGVQLAIENVWNDFITKPEQAVAFLDAIDSPSVGWHFDIGNVLRYSQPEDWVPVLGKRILKLHIKEYSALKSFKVRYLEGDNHWPAIMKALDAVGYQGWGIAEQPGEQSQDAAGLKDLSERMDRVFAS